MQVNSIDKSAFWGNGYALIKKVFSVAEIEDLRRRVLESEERKAGGELPPGDNLSNPYLSDLILDDRILSIVRTLLDGKPVYFGDSGYTIHRKPEKGTGSFHRDNVDRNDGRAPDWEGRYTLLRFGLYLQDHSHRTGGLVVRAGSHEKASSNRYLEALHNEVIGVVTGRTRYIASEVGDLVVWTLRTTHAGLGQCLKAGPPLPISERFLPYFPEWLLSPLYPGDRIGIFMTYGLDDHHLRRYLAYLKTRAYAVEIWKQCRYSKEVLDKIRGKDLTVLDMHQEIEAAIASGETLGMNRKWKPLPYQRV